MVPSKQQHLSQPQPQLQPLQQLAQTQVSENVGQLLVPSCSTDSFDSNQHAVSPSTAMEIQQSVIQGQTDVIDVKPSIIQPQSLGIKQELISPLQTNISPASPRAAVTTKPILTQPKLLSPTEKNDLTTSPRQGVKRSSNSSPVRSKINRSEL